MKNILLPLEKTSEEVEVIEEAVKIAQNFDSTITIFHVDDSKVIINEFQYNPKAYEEILKSREIDNAKMIKSYEDLGLKIQVKETAGDPAVEIIEEAKKGDYDLIIMKTHGMKATKRFMLGSVTDKVVHHVSIPVLVVR
ncbi:MAG: universal stress protein [Bacillota bacterium]|nr:universal stress protein [Bacillota bacterium]